MPFRFLDLPPELRHIVYTYLFTLTPPTLIFHDGHQKVSSSSASGGSIVQTCRLIHNEANPLLYALTTVRYTGSFIN